LLDHPWSNARELLLALAQGCDLIDVNLRIREAALVMAEIGLRSPPGSVDDGIIPTHKIVNTFRKNTLDALARE